MIVETIKMPRLGVNDETVMLGEWLIKNGEYVKAGQSVASIETSKETSEITVENDGYIFFEVEAGNDVQVDAQVAVLSDDPSFAFETKKESIIDFKITSKAQKLIDKYQIDISKLKKGKIIREKDVLALLNQSDPFERSKANDIIIVCAGGLAKMCIDLIRLNKSYNLYGVTDANANVGPDVLGVPYLGDINVLGELKEKGYLTAVNAIGSIAIDNTKDSFFLRKKIYQEIKHYGYFLPTLIHPSAEVAPSAELGEGALVFENAVIGSNAFIGDDCIINTGAIVSHDCKIASHSRISPGAILAGEVTVGENTLIGMGVTVYLGVHIGKNVIIANGMNIVSNIPDGAVVK